MDLHKMRNWGEVTGKVTLNIHSGYMKKKNPCHSQEYLKNPLPGDVFIVKLYSMVKPPVLRFSIAA